MGCLDGEALTAMSVLLKQGHTQSAVARLLGITEGAVRYHRLGRAEGAVDGRSWQIGKAAAYAEAIAHWRSGLGDGAINIAALHEWLTREHGYTGSLKSVQRYWSRTFPAPVIRARRRVETPPGAQAQVDWAEFPGMVLGEEVVDLSALVMTLSWTRPSTFIRCTVLVIAASLVLDSAAISLTLNQSASRSTMTIRHDGSSSPVFCNAEVHMFVEIPPHVSVSDCGSACKKDPVSGARCPATHFAAPGRRPEALATVARQSWRSLARALAAATTSSTRIAGQTRPNCASDGSLV